MFDFIMFSIVKECYEEIGILLCVNGNLLVGWYFSVNYLNLV